MKLRSVHFGVWWQSNAVTPLFARMFHVVPKRRGASLPVAVQRVDAFTLIELILVMALLVVAVSFVTPRFIHFFRGRALDSEARQIVALTHAGRSRAVSAGVPMLLWIDEKQGAYGLEEEPGYSDKDPDAEEFKLDSELQIEVPTSGTPLPALQLASTGPHASLPQIRFLADGTIGDTSPKTIRLIGPEGSLSLTESRDRTQYEIQ